MRQEIQLELKWTEPTLVTKSLIPNTVIARDWGRVMNIERWSFPSVHGWKKPQDCFNSSNLNLWMISFLLCQFSRHLFIRLFEFRGKVDWKWMDRQQITSNFGPHWSLMRTYRLFSKRVTWRNKTSVGRGKRFWLFIHLGPLSRPQQALAAYNSIPFNSFTSSNVNSCFSHARISNC